MIKKVIPIILIMLGFFVARADSYFEDINYQYTLDDVYYKQCNAIETFSVSIADIYKEEEKEDIYKLNYQNIINGNNYFSNLNKSDFEKMMGKENNCLTSEVYTLSLAVWSKTKSKTTTYFIDVQRFACLGEMDFTGKEIEEITILLLPVFSNENKKEGSGSSLEFKKNDEERYDMSELQKKVKCVGQELLYTCEENGMEGMLKLKNVVK